MLSNSEVEKILTLQHKSYDLFIWIAESLKWGRLQFSDKHVGLEPQDVMRRWITRNQGSFPENIKIKEISEADKTAFVNMALSFPVVSFEPVAGGQLIAGCDCGFCAVYARNHFEPKKLKPKDNERADHAVQLAIQTIAEDLNLNLTSVQLVQFQKKYPELNRQATLIAYVYDLDRRTRFEVQNSTGLALWRRLKQKTKIRHSTRATLMQRRLKNSPRFKITVNDYSSAVETLKKTLNEFVVKD